MDELDEGFPKPYDAIAGFRWWEGKRWIFNLAVGLVGIVGLLFGPSIGEDVDHLALLIVDIVVYGVVLNVCYCAGFFVEMVDQVYLKAIFRLAHYRIWLLALGTGASMLVTFGAAIASSIFTGQPF